jgi:hypothetical protein
MNQGKNMDLTLFNTFAAVSLDSPYTILVLIAMGLAIGHFFRPQWPLLNVSVLLVCIALLIGRA